MSAAEVRFRLTWIVGLTPTKCRPEVRVRQAGGGSGLIDRVVAKQVDERI